MTPRIVRLSAHVDRLDPKEWGWVIREDKSGWVANKKLNTEPVKFAAKNLEGAIQAIVNATKRAG